MTEPTGPPSRFDPNTAFYAWVGASDLALEAARKAAAEVQSQIEEARAQLRDLQRDPKSAVGHARSRIQGQLDTAARQLEQRATELRTNLGSLVDWDGLAARGQRVVRKGEPEAPAGQPGADQPMDRPMDQPMTQPMTQPMDQPTTQPLDRPMTQPGPEEPTL